MPQLLSNRIFHNPVLLVLLRKGSRDWNLTEVDVKLIHHDLLSGLKRTRICLKQPAAGMN